MKPDYYSLIIQKKYNKVIQQLSGSTQPSEELLRLMALQLKKKKSIQLLPEIQKMRVENIQPEFLIFEAELISRKYQKIRDIQQEEELIRRINNCDGTPYFASLIESLNYIENNNYELAVERLSTLVDSFPESDDARIILAWVHCRKKDYKQAVSVLKKTPQNHIIKINEIVVSLQLKRLLIFTIYLLGIIIFFITFRNYFSLIFLIVFSLFHFYGKSDNRYLIIRPLIDILLASSILAFCFFFLFLNSYLK
jgi:hypothetical protein